MNKGFTTIDLMISVGIIGMMAVVAVPTFEEYRTNAKKSESYIMMSAIRKAQMVYYVENNTFMNNFSWGQSTDLLEPALNSNGGKFALQPRIGFTEDGDCYDDALSYYSTLLQLTGESTYSFYAYRTVGGTINSDGDFLAFSIQCAENARSESEFDPDQVSLGFEIESGDDADDGDFDFCQFDTSLDNLGVSISTGESVNFISAATNSLNDGCSLAVGYLVAQDGQITSSPFIDFDMDVTSIEKGDDSGDSGDSGKGGDSGDSGKGGDSGDSGKGGDSGDSGKGGDSGDSGKGGATK